MEGKSTILNRIVMGVLPGRVTFEQQCKGDERGAM